MNQWQVNMTMLIYLNRILFSSFSTWFFQYVLRFLPLLVSLQPLFWYPFSVFPFFLDSTIDCLINCSFRRQWAGYCVPENFNLFLKKLLVAKNIRMLYLVILSCLSSIDQLQNQIWAKCCLTALMCWKGWVLVSKILT